MDRRDWEARLAAKQDKLGGDFWNADNIYRQAFSDPLVRSVDIQPVTTGLWADARVYIYNGASCIRRFSA